MANGQQTQGQTDERNIFGKAFSGIDDKHLFAGPLSGLANEMVATGIGAYPFAGIREGGRPMPTWVIRKENVGKKKGGEDEGDRGGRVRELGQPGAGGVPIIFQPRIDVSPHIRVDPEVVSQSGDGHWYRGVNAGTAIAGEGAASNHYTATSENREIAYLSDLSRFLQSRGVTTRERAKSSPASARISDLVAYLHHEVEKEGKLQAYFGGQSAEQIDAYITGLLKKDSKYRARTDVLKAQDARVRTAYQISENIRADKPLNDGLHI